MLYWVGSLQCFSVTTFGSFSNNDRDPFTELENSYLYFIFVMAWGFGFCFVSDCLFVFTCFKFLENPLLLI